MIFLDKFKEDSSIIDLDIFPEIIQKNWMYLVFSTDSNIDKFSNYNSIFDVKNNKLLTITSYYKNGQIELEGVKWLTSPDGKGLDGSQILLPASITNRINRIPAVKELNDCDYNDLSEDLLCVDLKYCMFVRHMMLNNGNTEKLIKKLSNLISELEVCSVLE